MSTGTSTLRIGLSLLLISLKLKHRLRRVLPATAPRLSASTQDRISDVPTRLA